MSNLAFNKGDHITFNDDDLLTIAPADTEAEIEAYEILYANGFIQDGYVFSDCYINNSVIVEVNEQCMCEVPLTSIKTVNNNVVIFS